MASTQSISEVILPKPSSKVIEISERKYRYNTHLTTDKSIYKLEETLYWSGYIFDVFNYSAQIDPEYHERAQLEIKGPSGEIMWSDYNVERDPKLASVLGGSVDIASHWKGGIYSLILTMAGSALGERKFEIRAYKAPKLNIILEYIKRGYGENEMVLCFFILFYLLQSCPVLSFIFVIFFVFR